MEPAIMAANGVTYYAIGRGLSPDRAAGA